MTQTSNFNDLCDLALWDLGDGLRALASRLSPIVSRVADPALRRDLTSLRDAANERSQDFFSLSAENDGPSNLWMAGVLDDAERDARTLPEGVLRDVALIGAVRKMLQAERASHDTAYALARHLGHDNVMEGVTRSIDRNRADDDRLLAALSRLVGRSAETSRPE